MPKFNDMTVGLLGKKLGHSYSPEIHKYFADYKYGLFEKTEDEVVDFIKNGPWDCLNVTIPYKKVALECADNVSDIAQRIGSSNTLVKKNGKIFADNTDYYGFTYLVKQQDLKRFNKALILGSGGAYLAVKTALEDLGYKNIICISRSGDDNYQNLTKHSDADLIVNTTPVGMYPDCNSSPINDLNIFKNLECVIDIIYNPKNTKLLNIAQENGIKVSGGLGMLVAQAAKACEVFTNSSIDTALIGKVTATISKKMQNIVLVGMPGCGKTTISRALCKLTGRKVIDTDDEFFSIYKVKSGDYISNYSEAVFRKKESEIVDKVSSLSGNIISTGGGVVETKENFEYLKRNSVVVYIKRPLESLATIGRPLSKNLDLLFKKRSSLYEKLCDFSVDNIKTPDECATLIIDKLDKLYQK